MSHKYLILLCLVAAPASVAVAQTGESEPASSSQGPMPDQGQPQASTETARDMQQRLRAVEEIIGATLATKFDAASEIAMNRLPLAKDIPLPKGAKQAAGPFHASVDHLASTLQGKDMRASLEALNKVLTNCTACHQQTKSRP